MGKSVPSTTRLQELARIVTSNKPPRPKHIKPVPKNRLVPPPEPTKPRGLRVESKMEEKWLDKQKQKQKQIPVPLADVVSDCVKRWFQDTLKEAKAGDTSMQVLVGQMYFTGYGVPKDAHKGRAWITKASRSRSSVWKVSDKQPGYNASDSDSDDIQASGK